MWSGSLTTSLANASIKMPMADSPPASGNAPRRRPRQVVGPIQFGSSGSVSERSTKGVGVLWSEAFSWLVISRQNTHRPSQTQTITESLSVAGSRCASSFYKRVRSGSRRPGAREGLLGQVRPWLGLDWPGGPMESWRAGFWLLLFCGPF